MAIDFKVRQIIKEKGYISIDEMMKEVLYNNSISYYRLSKAIGVKGDFITSPEVSQLFGETIGLWAIEKWYQLGQPDPILLVELGPGEGTLMRDILRVIKLVPKFMQSLNIQMVDINYYFIKKQKKKLVEYQNKINWIEKIYNIKSYPTIFVANEFFDAMPIKQYIKNNKWEEQVLIIDPIDNKIKYSTIALSEDLHLQLSIDYCHAYKGAVIEESIKSLEITGFLAQHLKSYKGCGIIIDYGYNINPKYRSHNKYYSTLQAIKNHNYKPVIDSLGKADLSAHVDFYALEKKLKENKIENYAFYKQNQFLKKYGILVRAEQLKQKITKQDKEIIDKQLYRLMDKKEMGQLFKVLEILIT